MANHRRKHKLRGKKDGRRFDNKRQRAAERQELDGGKPKLIRSGGWAFRPRQPLAFDDRSISKAKPKKRKDRSCPGRAGNKRHHYMYGERVVPSWRFDRELWDRTGEWSERRCQAIERYKLCAYCPKEEVLGWENID